MMSNASDFSDRTHPDTICLFDVDGTLTPARLVRSFLHSVHPSCQEQAHVYIDPTKQAY